MPVFASPPVENPCCGPRSIEFHVNVALIDTVDAANNRRLDARTHRLGLPDRLVNVGQVDCAGNGTMTATTSREKVTY